MTTSLRLIVLLMLSGCAYIQPIPCEDLPVVTADGGRIYKDLCP